MTSSKPQAKKIYVGPINKTRLLHLTLYLIKLIDKRIIMQHNMMIDYTYAGNWSNFNINEKIQLWNKITQKMCKLSFCDFE